MMKVDGLGVALLGLTMFVLVAGALILAAPQVLPVCSGDCSVEDLSAQQAMASAAWWMVWVTAGSAVIGAAGIVFLLANLTEARNASHAATRSAVAAEESLKASKAAAEAATTVARAQVRAHVVVHHAQVTVQGGQTLVSFDIINAGQSPARAISTSGRLRYWLGEDEPVTLVASDPVGITALPSSLSESGIFTFPSMKMGMGKNIHIMVEAKTFYLDVFDELFEELATFELITTVDPNLGNWRKMRDAMGSMA